MRKLSQVPTSPRWHTRFLRFAAFYNMGWGVLILTRPEIYYQSFYHRPVLPPWWLAPLGALVILFGIFYFQSSYDPPSYRNLILLCLMSKVLGPGVNWFLFMRGEELNYPSYYLSVLFNDLIWVAPLAIICWRLFPKPPH